MRKCWVSPVGPRCALRYTPRITFNVRFLRSPQSTALSSTYVQRKPSIRETIALHNTAKAIISTALARERKSKQRHAKREWQARWRRRPWRDFVRAHCCYLCAYTRILDKRNTGSRAFNHLAYVATRYVMNTHSVRVTAKRTAYEIFGNECNCDDRPLWRYLLNIISLKINK